MSRELREVIDEARRQGWRVVQTKKGAILYSSDGTGKVTVHGTESDRRAIQNTISRMRHFGFQWPPGRQRR